MKGIIVFLFAVIFAGSSAQNCQERYGSSCYFFGRESVSQDAAQRDCQRKKGDLVQIESSGEQKFLYDAVKTRPGVDFWIGLEAVRDMAYQQVGWRWFRGASLRNDVANWGSGKPDDVNQHENCVVYRQRQNYMWDDAHCSEQYGYICEMRA